MTRFNSLIMLLTGLSLLSLLFASGCGAGGAGMMRVRAENWQPTPGGSIQTSDLGSLGDVVDLDGVLGLDGEEKFWVYGIEGDVGIGTYEVTEINFTGSGSSTLTSDIDFSGTVFENGSELNSNLEASVTTFHSKGALLGMGPVMVKYIWGVDHLYLDTTLSGTTSEGKGGSVAATASSTIDEWVPAFGVGANLAIPIGNDWSMEFDGEISGLWISYGDIDGTYEGMTIRAGVRQGSGILFGAGHRSLVIDVADDGTGTSADIDLGGTYLFVEWAF